MIAVIDRGTSPKKVSPASSKLNGAHNKYHKPDYTSNQDNNQHLGFSELHILMRGKWRGCHTAGGIILRPIGKQCDCQGCGGTDRFSFQRDYEETGRWFCRQGGDPTGGDGFALFGHVFGWSPAEQLRYVTDYLGLSTIDNKEATALRKKAEKQARELQAAIAKKDEQARHDSNLLTMLENQIDVIRHRQWLQRQAVRFNGNYIAEPTIDEITTAQELNEAILEAYAHKRGVDYA